MLGITGTHSRLAFSTVMCAQAPVKPWSPKLAVKSPSAADVQFSWSTMSLNRLVPRICSAVALSVNHSSTGSPLQTYATIDFDTTGLFPEGLQDSGELAQEIAGWINDPFFTNTAPGWTRGADSTDCENTFEVGTPLDGLNAPPIVMRNGFTYHLPELAFFSWFFGKPSTAIHHWYSSNGSLLTDAGPACQVTDASMTAGDWRLRQVPSQLQ
ncbi:MAG TPA: hypothetical protein VMF91_15055 [Bryobacteraceae bacterium]|nr:hypothetical protein [Bryobacteraceae bacterium]